MIGDFSLQATSRSAMAIAHCKLQCCLLGKSLSNPRKEERDHDADTMQNMQEHAKEMQQKKLATERKPNAPPRAGRAAGVPAGPGSVVALPPSGSRPEMSTQAKHE